MTPQQNSRRKRAFSFNAASILDPLAMVRGAVKTMALILMASPALAEPPEPTTTDTLTLRQETEHSAILEYTNSSAMDSDQGSFRLQVGNIMVFVHIEVGDEERLLIYPRPPYEAFPSETRVQDGGRAEIVISLPVY